MKFRHEYKHEINLADVITLRQRLRVVMKPDGHAVDGRYEIRGLYFDNPDDAALMEKINGVNNREKFRLRYYNGDTDLIKLEKKSKINGLCLKESVEVTKEETERLLAGDYSWMMQEERPLLKELYVKMNYRGLRPKTIVDYTREAFVFAAGNVRVTLDYNIRSGLGSTDFLSDECVTVPVSDCYGILEVKWDEFLPDIIRDAVQLEGRHSSAYSKYAACRRYG